MPDQLQPPKLPETSRQKQQYNALRTLSRSPHPYHRQQAELPHSSFKPRVSLPSTQSPLRSTQNTDDEACGDSTPLLYVDLLSRRSSESDSGTEADDEHFLLGLPAPRWRPHKGLRGSDGTLSGTPSPLLSPAILNEDGGRGYLRRVSPASLIDEREARKAVEKLQRRRRNEVMRRVLEVLLLIDVGEIVRLSDNGLTANVWDREIYFQKAIFGSLLVLYPVRILYQRAVSMSPGMWFTISIPASFDPAPLLYPSLLPNFVATLLSHAKSAAFLPNLILSNSSLPTELIPSFAEGHDVLTLHWLISLVPLFAWESRSGVSRYQNLLAAQNLDREVLVLLYPLHQTLCATLHYLTTTSLLKAELQLLSIALINLLLLSTSPQTIILKALLWGGGVAILLLCGRVLGWGVALARIPKWRFRRTGKSFNKATSSNTRPETTDSSFMKLKRILSAGNELVGDDSEDDHLLQPRAPRPSDMDVKSRHMNGRSSTLQRQGSLSSFEQTSHEKKSMENGSASLGFADSTETIVQRRHTLPNVGHHIQRSSKRTASGRRKRSASSSMQGFFSLTERQATFRKWAYAAYVYICVIFVILAGIRTYVGKYALGGSEPIGWALGYLMGNIPWFRMEIITMNLERWVCLPERSTMEAAAASCQLGWVEHLRHSTFGLANTRLILCAYWLAIIIVGLAVVFHLSAIYEVDTRRKVFHFMMVAMLLPATYVDPTFAALALSLVLAIFLLLDLFRASQLPPLSKPLAYFLTPYVDGRDLRGPVVISHIFLLIGCAIPLWLSLGALPRTGTGLFAGWEVPTRDVSMVSGVICVGMGDAAASLIGRRYGRHKWFWVGGKSIEGSIAFATAVSLALVLAKIWLLVGGWSDGGGGSNSWLSTIWKSVTAACVASLTEAVLTGGNDNVVVPVVLWLCVKGLKM